MNKPLKIVLIVLASIIGLVAVLGIGYVVYMTVTYYRIEDNLAVETLNQQTEVLKVSEEYTALTYNVGFGAYDQEFAMFMDKGNLKDGTPLQGAMSWGRSKEIVEGNINGTIKTSSAQNADFYLFQEVDTDSTRSYGINQKEMIEAYYKEYGSAYGINFHSSFLAYPFLQPHGFANSGVLTLSKYNISESVRRSYPVDDDFINKHFDLDRCFLMTRLPVENGKELVLINSHMSAYDEGGLIRSQQLELLNQVMKEEYDKGNYVIVGGDFNHDLVDMIGKYPSNQQVPPWVAKMNPADIVDGFSIVAAKNYTEVATCRSACTPYVKGDNFLSTLDGFIVSDNVKAEAINIDDDFMYSDHNPAKLSFVLE